MLSRSIAVVIAVSLLALSSSVQALDQRFMDTDGDLVADMPKDPKLWIDPPVLIFSYTPVEDPAVYANIFKPLTDHLAACTGKRIVYYPVQSNSAEIEAMRSGR
ncbi:MAG: PhnD/SsuA/transferrin family substrate-binding protein, partial [Pseudorhodoplanes sp.]